MLTVRKKKSTLQARRGGKEMDYKEHSLQVNQPPLSSFPVVPYCWYHGYLGPEQIHMPITSCK